MPPTTRKKPTVSAAEKKRRSKQSAAAAPPEPKNLGRGGGWTKGSDLGPVELKLPSGATCLVAPPTPEDLIMSGVDAKMDALTSQVHKDLIEPVKGPAGIKRTIAGHELTNAQLLDSVELADRVTVAVCVSPVVHLAPAPHCLVCGWEGSHVRNHTSEDGHDPKLEPRDPNAYYTDGISLVDKFAILAWALEGPREVAGSFPEEAESGVEPVSASEDVALPPESNPGD